MKIKQLDHTVLICITLLLPLSTNCFGFDNDNKDINLLVSGNTDFAFVLYDKLRNDQNAIESKGNLFFSPYSISTALAMTYGGACGETQRQMADVLHFTLPVERLYHASAALQRQLIQEGKSSGYHLRLANALWGQKDVFFLKEFLDLAQGYGADLRQVDFVKEIERSRQTINFWVEEETNHKIKNLITPGSISRDTDLVLTNATYFKGDWQTKFEKDDTQKADFYISANDKVEADMMHIKGNFKCYTNEKMRILELPYKGNELSMLVLLPNDPNSFSEIENTLTAKSFNVFLSEMQPIEINVYFPKFKISWGTFSLKNTLKELGMPEAFEKADFSGMTGTKDLVISDVLHKAFVEVNEEGTEAAAATAIVMAKCIRIQPVFCADHPFIFFIKDNPSGSILFIGRIMNPIDLS